MRKRRFGEVGMTKRGFTLIELLIVIAIILILISIALPNFLEAQVRAKITSAKASQRSLATAFEAYRADNRNYPLCDIILPFSGIDTPSRVMLKESGVGKARTYDGYWPTDMTTPVRYMTSLPKDPFPTILWDATGLVGAPYALKEPDTIRNFMVWIWPHGRTNIFSNFKTHRSDVYYLLVSPGPSHKMVLGLEWETDQLYLKAMYSPTNGTVSLGDLTMFGP